jgi:hypothetical protein
LFGILARGLVVKLLRVGAAALVTGLLARLLVDPCSTDIVWQKTTGWFLLLASPVAALVFALPRPTALRYIDNSVAIVVGVGLGAYWSYAVVETACYEVALHFLNAVLAAAIGLAVGLALFLAWGRLTGNPD